jgi:hypothetical protein
MDITINTPALLFPALSLIMLAYTNRFLAISSVVRTLHDRYVKNEPTPVIHAQIKNLRYRLLLIRRMQLLGVLSFLFAIVCMYLIFVNEMMCANVVFVISTLFLVTSLILSLLEILNSTKSLELELSDIEGLSDPTLVEYIKKKFE